MKLSEGEWEVTREKLNQLPRLHVIIKKPSDAGKITFLASIHETNTRGEAKFNAQVMAAAKDMYEAITIGLTGKDLNGNVVNQKEAIERLRRAKDKAEGNTK